MNGPGDFEGDPQPRPSRLIPVGDPGLQKIVNAVVKNPRTQDWRMFDLATAVNVYQQTYQAIAAVWGNVRQLQSVHTLHDEAARELIALYRKDCRQHAQASKAHRDGALNRQNVRGRQVLDLYHEMARSITRKSALNRAIAQRTGLTVDHVRRILREAGTNEKPTLEL